MSDKTATEIASSLNPTIRDIIRSKNDLIRKLSRDLSELKSEAKDCAECAAESAARVEELETQITILCEALKILAAQSSGIPGSTALSDCMAAIAKQALQRAGGGE